MNLRHLLSFSFALGLLLFSWNCEKALNDPNNGNNGNNGNTTDTVYFSVQGVRFANGLVYDIGYTGAKIKGEFSSVANDIYPIQQHGFVWATDKNNLSILKADDISELGAKTSPGQFVSEMTNLTPNTLYYVTGYVTSNGNTAYHPNSLAFKTLEGKAPVMATGVATDITHNAANISNVITDFIGTKVLEHGHVWGTSPTVDLTNCGNNKTAKGAVEESDDYPFSSAVQGLTANTQYYFKAYATNEFGSSYSTAADFKTLPLPAPNLIIQSVSYSEPNGTGNINPGENVTISITLKNIGNADAHGVKLSLNPSIHYTINTPLPLQYDDILAGGQKTASIVVAVGSVVPWGTIVTESAAASDGSGMNWPFENAISFTVISPYVVSDGLAFYLRFNECSGTLVSSRVGDFIGDLFSPDFSTDVIPGTNGCSMDFSAQAKDYIQFPVNPVYGFAEVSFSFWLKTAAGSGTIFQTIGNSGDNLNLIYDDNIFYGGYSNELDFNIGYALNDWHHFVVTGTENQLKLYIDGIFKNQTTSGVGYHTSYATGGCYVGKNSYPNWDFSYFQGKLDNFRIYNRVLTPTEIVKIFTAKE